MADRGLIRHIRMSESAIFRGLKFSAEMAGKLRWFVMEHKIGQLFMIGISGTELTKDEADFITKNNIGGVILFSRNCESPEQIHKLCCDLQSLRNNLPEKAPLFIGIDMEGGRVHRLKPPFTTWPSIRQLGDLDSTLLSFNFAKAMGTELRSVGINLNFAPCADILTNEANTVIGDRSPGTNPEIVSKISSALARGYIKSYIFSCVKHFPGHGHTKSDSHEELPVEQTDLETLKNRELQPFKKVLRTKIDFVMTGHILFPKIDDHPVTLSEFFLKKIIREELRYKNIIITDDLDMKALRHRYEVKDIPIAALKAGCDILLYCNEPESQQVGIENVRAVATSDLILTERITDSYSRVMRLKSSKLAQAESWFSPPDFSKSREMIGHPDHLKIAQAVCNGKIPKDLPH